MPHGIVNFADNVNIAGNLDVTGDVTIGGNITIGDAILQIVFPLLLVSQVI